MRRPASLGAFVAVLVLAFPMLTLAWAQVSAWAIYPAAGIAHIVLGNAASGWIRHIDKRVGTMVVETRIRPAAALLPPDVAGGTARARQAEIDLDIDAAHYGYSLPLFLALLLASGGRNFWRRAVVGYGVLLLPQAFSIIFLVFKELMVAAGGPAALGLTGWQAEGISLGYQMGSLLMPTVAPVLLWLWLDRDMLRSVIVEGGLAKSLPVE